MKRQVRIERIRELLQRDNGLTVHTLADHLGVSHMTVRRDLDRMHEEGIVRLIHGGVILTESPLDRALKRPYSLNTAETERVNEKMRIGMRAAELIEDHDTIIIDSGSTTECLARHVPADLSLTILAYSLNIVDKLAPLENVRVLFAGGVLHRNTLMFESPEGMTVIRRFRATKAFISAAGITREFGVTCLNDYERETKIAAMESSARKILVADSSKFGVLRSDYFADLNRFDCIVTDDNLSDDNRRMVEDLGIPLILA